MLSHKTPRDFIHLDEFWEADQHWGRYFVSNNVWVYVDEYRAELPGDEDYSRIIIHGGDDTGWIYSRRLNDRDKVQQTLEAIKRPVSARQLANLGFTPWQTSYV
ncbi:Uncharacterised protein [Halioglobus japonicus]|nr:Uncharacterised protein [Halioglobus japonicus]